MFGGRISRAMRFVLPVLLVLVLASAAYAQAGDVKEVKLDNGLTVLMKEVHAAPVITAQVWFDVGSMDEYTGITGISHLLEHMLFGTSKNYKKGEITGLIRERGGIDNAATWTDFTYYWELLSSEHLEFALETLAERLGNALLLEEELEKERTVVLSEMEGGENNPDRVLYQAVMATAFKAHPYQWPTIGWESDVKNISREQLVEYYEAYYHPNNATLVLVGDFDSDRALELIKKYFGDIPAGELPRPVYTEEPEQRGPRTVTIRREGNAERVILGYHVPSIDHPDSYALMVLDQILSGGRASRLYQSLVDEQLATAAWSTSGIRKDPALFMIGAVGRQGVTADRLQKAIEDQVEEARTTLPTEREMKAAKNQLEAYLVYQNDSVSDQGEQLGYYNTVASWEYLNTLIPRIKAVTAEEVQTVAQKYLVNDNITVGKFIPTAPESAPAGPGAGPIFGPIHKVGAPDASLGVNYKDAANANATIDAADNDLVRPHRVVLDNGITVIVQENKANPTIAIRGNIKAGSYFDPEDKSGVASLTADMLNRGTKERTALEIAQETEFVGAEIDTSAAVEAAYFDGKALSKDFPLVMELLADQLRNASFPEDEFEKAKGEKLSSLEQSKESTNARAFRAFYNNVFPKGHAYHDLTFEEARDQLQAVTREDVVEFHSNYYRPDTMNIVIVGDVDAENAVEIVKKYFGDWKAEGPKPEVDIPTIEPAEEPTRVVIPMMDKSEVSVVFGHALGIKRDNPDYYAVRIMNQILGGSGALASRLGKEIREKQGLVYSVYSTYDATLGAGPWYAALGTNPKNVDQAVTTLENEIEEFIEEGATPEQFKQAQQFIIGVFPIALETNAGVAGALLSAEFYGLGMDYLRNYDDYYRSVTIEEVNEAAKKYLHPDDATLVIAGPYEGDN